MLCGPKTTNHRPINAYVQYISPAHPQASPVREQRAVHKSRLDLCPIKASAELVVTVLDVDSSKGSTSKSISKKTKQRVNMQALAKLAGCAPEANHFGHPCHGDCISTSSGLPARGTIRRGREISDDHVGLNIPRPWGGC